MSVLFPNGPPPIPDSPTPVDDACVWMLAVMDKGDPSRRFVASVFLYFLEHGSLSGKQIEALRRVYGKTIRRFYDGALRILGGDPAHDQTIATGEVHRLRTVGGSRYAEEVIE